MNYPNDIVKDMGSGCQNLRTGRFYPYQNRIISLTSPTLTPDNPSQGFFVRSVRIAVRLVAADVTTRVYVQGIWFNQGGRGQVSDIQTVPSVAGTYHLANDVFQLFDPGRNITLTAVTGDPTFAQAALVLAQVDDL